MSDLVSGFNQQHASHHADAPSFPQLPPSPVFTICFRPPRPCSMRTLPRLHLPAVQTNPVRTSQRRTCPAHPSRCRSPPPNRRPARAKTTPFSVCTLAPPILFTQTRTTRSSTGATRATFDPTDKLLYAAHEQTRWAVLLPGLYSAGYGQLVDTDPHTGSDLGGFGERLGLTMMRQATDRVSGDESSPRSSTKTRVSTVLATARTSTAD